MHIQDVLREEMKESTVITIAHRVEAVKDADSVIVLDNGRLAEHRSIASPS
jgi:ABC-type multidrug transport system fused ATPase/permease subunit